MDAVVQQMGEISSALLLGLAESYTPKEMLIRDDPRCRYLDRRAAADQGRRQSIRHESRRRGVARKPPVTAHCKSPRQHGRANPYSADVSIVRSSTAVHGRIARIRLDLAVCSDLAAAAADILDLPTRKRFKLTVSAAATNEPARFGQQSWFCARRFGAPRLVGFAGRAPLRVAYAAAHSGFAGRGRTAQRGRDECRRWAS